MIVLKSIGLETLGRFYFGFGPKITLDSLLFVQTPHEFELWTSLGRVGPLGGIEVNSCEIN